MKKLLNICVKIAIAILVIVLIINSYVIGTTKERIIKDENYSTIQDVDCIVILGAGIWGDEPSPMLQDRLEEGIRLYHEGVAPKIIMGVVL